MDTRPPPLRLVYSDELGQLKVVQTADGTQLGTAAVAATWGQPDKAQLIDCSDLGSSGGIGDTGSAVLAVARRSGAIELLSPLTGNLIGTIPPASSSSSGGSSNGSSGKQQEDAVRVRGLHLLWGEGEAASGLPAVLSVTQGGTARLHAPAAQQQQQQQQEGEQQPQQQQAASVRWEERRSWQVPAEVCCTAYDAASGRLAVGCQGAELRLFDVASGELAFTFKGGKPNMVGLVDRPWNTAIVFLPPTTGSPPASASGAGGGSGKEEAGSSPVPGSRLLVGTGYHKVRLYDSEAGKRPQMDLSWREGRVMCMALEPDGQRCWVGNGVGQIEVLDLRTRTFTGAVKGMAGSARALACHPTAPVLACVGLDRYLRLHSTETRKQLAKVYLKTLPTGVAFCPTDASMLPPLKEEESKGKKGKGKEKRRRQKEAASGSDGEGSDFEVAAADSGPESEQEDDRKQKQRRSSKQSKPRQEGSSNGRHNRGRKQRPAAGADSD